MANVKLSIFLITIFTFGTFASQQLKIAPRLINGIPIDTLRRFAHHVIIVGEYEDTPTRSLNKPESCGATLINERWVLTSAFCVDQTIRLKLKFEKLYINDNTRSYAAVVNSVDAVYVYPTNYDDIALVKLPFKIVPSDTIKAVNIGKTPLAQLENKLAVLPGFDSNGLEDSTDEQQLTYAMLNIIPNTKCKELSINPDEFDEYLQLCTVDWNNNQNRPCGNDNGTGLIVGWPSKPELVGISSGKSENCDYQTTTRPSVYTYVPKYASWIQRMINS